MDDIKKELARVGLILEYFMLCECDDPNRKKTLGFCTGFRSTNDIIRLVCRGMCGQALFLLRIEPGILQIRP